MQSSGRAISGAASSTRRPLQQNVSPHDLRHTAASLLIASGAHVKAVQRMLGHASAAMTLDVYSGLFDDNLSALAERMDVAHDQRSRSVLWAS